MKNESSHAQSMIDDDPLPLQSFAASLVTVGAQSDLARTTVGFSLIRKLAGLLDVGYANADLVILAAIKAVEAANASEFEDDDD